MDICGSGVMRHNSHRHFSAIFKYQMERGSNLEGYEGKEFIQIADHSSRLVARVVTKQIDFVGDRSLRAGACKQSPPFNRAFLHDSPMRCLPQRMQEYPKIGERKPRHMIGACESIRTLLGFVVSLCCRLSGF